MSHNLPNPIILDSSYGPITLRDLFALMALSVLAGKYDTEIVAISAYEHADAMLRERIIKR